MDIVDGRNTKFQKYECKVTVGKKSTKINGSQPKEILKPEEYKGNKSEQCLCLQRIRQWIKYDTTV